LAGVQAAVELKKSFLCHVFSLRRISEGCDHIAIDGLSPLLKIAGDFLFELQCFLSKLKEIIAVAEFDPAARNDSIFKI
jgi:hypothetical protein